MIDPILLDQNEVEGLVFLKRDDLGPLIIDYLKLIPNELSPFTEVLGSYVANSAPLSVEAKALAEEETNRILFSALAAPDLLIRNRLGGSMVQFDEIRIVGARSIGTKLVVASLAANSEYVLSAFDDSRDFAAWWANSFGGKNDQTVANYIPPTVSLDAFMLILHAIDWFKRESYQNALDYAAGRELLVVPEQFTEGIKVSLQSKDMRWLLPAFVMLVPGIERYQVQIKEDSLTILHDKQFFNNTRDPQTGAERLVFAEAGRNMGIEFMRSWILAAGFEFNLINSTGTRKFNQLFIAPTALANHFVKLEPVSGNSCTVNHQAYTLQNLTHKLENIVSEAMAGYVDKEPEPVKLSATPSGITAEEISIASSIDGPLPPTEAIPVPPPVNITQPASDDTSVPLPPDISAPSSPGSSAPQTLEASVPPPVDSSAPPPVDGPVPPPLDIPVPPPVSRPVPPPVQPPATETEPVYKAPAGQWYLSRGGNQYGPYSFEQLVQYANQGSVQPEDQVWNDEMGSWVRADNVQGLF